MIIIPIADYDAVEMESDDHATLSVWVGEDASVKLDLSFTYEPEDRQGFSDRGFYESYVTSSAQVHLDRVSLVGIEVGLTANQTERVRTLLHEAVEAAHEYARLNDFDDSLLDD